MTPQAARDRSSLFQVLRQASTGAFVVLVATGVFLLFFYQPSAAAAWGDLYDISDTGSIGQTMQIVHRWSGYLLIPLGLAMAIVGLGQKSMTASRRLGLLTFPLLTGAALLTGFFLPWQQLALTEVRVVTDARGYWLILDDGVKFFLTNQGVVGPGTMTWYLATHLTVSLILAAVLVLTRAVTPRT